jgi:hypothetical protein
MRNEVIAKAIYSVLIREGWSPIILEEKAPRGLWVEVLAELPQNIPVPRDSAKLSNHVKRNKKEIIELVNAFFEVDEVETIYQPDSGKVEKQSRPHQLTEDDVRSIVLEELAKRAPNISSTPLEDDILCPEPEFQDKTHKRMYYRVSVTVDQNLWNLFKADQKRWKTTTPHLLDSILWKHYNHPKLSFED